MKLGNYKEISNKLDYEISKIFQSYNLDTLSQFEKRKIIFDYCVNEIKYDKQKLLEIKFQKTNPYFKIERNPYFELESVINNKIGICNAISQYYKLLLEKVSIYSCCINCIIYHDNEKLGHQLNLVYNSDKTFSFDDVTLAILEKEDNYFNFDMNDAKNKKEKYGIEPIYDNNKWMILNEEYINLIIGRNKEEIKNELTSNYRNIKTSNVNLDEEEIIIRKR